MTVRIDPDDAILDLAEAIGTFAECLERSNVKGAFDNYRFCVQNGRQVLLGHHTLISGRRRHTENSVRLFEHEFG